MIDKESVLTSTVIKVISYLFILLFLYAAVSKLLDFEVFTVQLAQSPLLSAYAELIAWLVPGIEIIIAVLLVVPKFRIIALYAAFTLMVMFTAYIFIILNFSDFIPCSCGGVLEKLSWTQHLIFNVIFIFLAGVAVLVMGLYRLKKTLFLLATLAIIGIGIVTLLFAFSEKKMHRNNAFIRRYPHHPIVPKDTLDLTYNSYYFAGGNDKQLYLGNFTAPKQVLQVSNNLMDTIYYHIQLPKSNIDYKYPRLRIIDSTFFLFDGTVPIIHAGSIKDWVVQKTFYPKAFFTIAEPVSAEELVIRTISSNTGNNILGTIEMGSISKVQLYTDVLKGNIDGYFDRDGQLLVNSQLHKVIYVYYYKNQFLVASPNLTEIQNQNTIDTIQVPQIDVKKLTSSQQRQLGGKSVRINGLTASYGNYLFVNSDRLGKYEPEEIIENAAIMDVYNIHDQTYEFSFYLYYNKKEKLLSFTVYGRNIYALIGSHLYQFAIKDKYLNFIRDENTLREARDETENL
ncbi:MauE/DoxX family redox-associated membrane protein [Aequorivita flava]|uniref:MauE/DoxX family redox-associated membrane protein n=1 Tax=Aequorivita flava TaxID=3114371 RepID=A0AB35YUZ0_9FLAO